YLTNKIINTSPVISNVMLCGERSNSNVEPLPRAYKMELTPIVINIKPVKSNFKSSFLSVGFKYLIQKKMHVNANGMLKRNKNGQVKNSITIPPTVGPIAGATIAEYHKDQPQVPVPALEMS